MNLTISHEKEALADIERIIKVFNPELIIELGTYKGGFTWLLHHICPDAETYSFDNKALVSPELKRILAGKVLFHIADILVEPYPYLQALCALQTKKLLYCDNGNKAGEIWMYAHCLRSGDMLGVHDWGIEFQYEHIKQALQLFKPLEHKTFEKIGTTTRFWVKGKG